MNDIRLFAQPYDITAAGFHFTTIEEYREEVQNAFNDHGDPVEEFEIQFIDGERIDCAFADAWQLGQATVPDFMTAVDDWDDAQKLHYIIAVGECGYQHADAWRVPDSIEIDIYEIESMRELAEQFVDEGLFGDIPKHLANYIDLDAIARDLSCDYAETTIAGRRFVYRCA